MISYYFADISKNDLITLFFKNNYLITILSTNRNYFSNNSISNFIETNIYYSIYLLLYALLYIIIIHDIYLYIYSNYST